MKKYRFLIMRRFVQLGLLLLFAGTNYWGWTILKGNYSSGLLFDTIPLTDPLAALQMFFSGVLLTSDLLVGALIVLLLYGLIFGRLFCSWICPVNPIADLALFASSKWKIKNKKDWSRNIRYGMLVLTLVLSVILGFSAFEAISPIGILHRGVIFGFGAGWAVVAALFLFDLAVLKNGWCGHFCPLGAFYSLVGRFSLLKVAHSKDACTNCMKCFAVCHEPQVLKIIGKANGLIKSGECTNCARCIEVCDDKALGFSLKGWSNKN